ncbi:MAG: GAF domain-containing protein, partial [Chloroflexi bacterium]|nr:GAF domain-containing protein [Chloroflexota bacterium]
MLVALAQRVASSLDRTTVFQEVVDAGCVLTKARYGAMAVFDSSGVVSEFYSSGITAQERRRIGEFPTGLGVLDTLKNAAKPLRLADLTTHPKSVGFPPHHPPMRTLLGAPIRYQGQALGSIYLTEKADGQEFTKEDQDLLMLLVAQAANAIHNADLHQAVESQRRRLEVLVDASPVGVLVAEAETDRILLV